MQITADLHIHSKYSRAVSPKMNISEIAQWAKRKAIDLVATGDWTHPLWLREIKANLEEDGTGLLRLKDAGVIKARIPHFRGDARPSLDRKINDDSRLALRKTAQDLDGKKKAGNSGFSEHSEMGIARLNGGSPRPSVPRFLLSTEISSIYTQGGRQRRIHNLVFAPSIKVVEKINKELTKKGANLLSDGRPIIGLTAEELAKLVLGVDRNCLIVPAHIWTPWYSLFGSKSGFDSIEECFGKMSRFIYGIETGLSSDPEMNWRIKELDDRAILSFSDAHSPSKLGREATVFELKQFSYYAIAQAIKAVSFSEKSADISSHQPTSENQKNSDISDLSDVRCQPMKADFADFSGNRIAYTIEFYPEEGKYHYTGHRKCEISQSPEETKKLGKTCPVCGQPLTVGVMHRVEQLAERETKNQKPKTKNDENGVRWISYNQRPPYATLVPLLEILGEALETSSTSIKVKNEYKKLIASLGGEFTILLETPINQIAKVVGEKVAEGILRVRSGKVSIEPGFDGQFGKVKIWGEEEKSEEKKKQMSLF